MNRTTTSLSRTIRLPGRLHHAGLGSNVGLGHRSSRLASCSTRSSPVQISARRSYSVNTEGPQKKSLGARLSHAWNSTPTKWYPIPVALGAAVLLAVQYKKSPFAFGAKEDQAVVESEGEGGARVKMKSSGPWQVTVLGALPLRSLSQLWGYLNGLVLPVWFRPFGFKLYSAIFGCDLSEIEPADLKSYESLGEFFYRRLKDGARPIDTRAALVSPADGTVLHFGEIAEGGRVEQVKGITYSLGALLGTGGQSSTRVEEIASGRDAKTVDDEHFAKINDIEYSLSSLLGSSESHTQVKEPNPNSGSDTSANPVATNQPHDATPDEMKNDPTKMSHDAQVAMKMGPSASLNAQTLDNDDNDTNPSMMHHHTGSNLPIKPGHKMFFMVVYLAPGDYHRFHSPTSWVVEKRRHFTGDLFSVSPYIAKRMQDLFVLNERVTLLGRWRYGFFGMVPVGATNVGSICINFDKNLRTNERYPQHPPHTFTEAVYTQSSAFLKGQPLTAGEEMGGFKLGSTIVLVFEAPEGFRFVAEAGKKVKVGQKLGVIDEA